MSNVIPIVKSFIHRFLHDRVLDLSAQCAYYFLFAIFPFLIFVLTLVAFLPFTSVDVMGFIAEIAPSDTNELLEQNIEMVFDVKRTGTLSVSLLFTLWSASKGMDALVKSLNSAYHVQEERSFIRSKLLSIFLTIGLFVMFLSALVLTVFGGKVQELLLYFLNISGDNIIISAAFRWGITFLIVSVTLIVLYAVGPNMKIKCKHVIPGALIAAFMWQSASVIFSFYVNQFGNFSATYGSLGGVIILMIWFYLSATIIMIGGIINALIPNWVKKVRDSQ